MERLIEVKLHREGNGGGGVIDFHIEEVTTVGDVHEELVSFWTFWFPFYQFVFYNSNFILIYVLVTPFKDIFRRYFPSYM